MAKETEKKDVKVKRPTPLKRNDQSQKRRLANRSFSAGVSTAIRHFDEAVAKGESAVAKEQLHEVYGLMDKGVKKGVFKLNTASRTKSRLASKI